MKKPYKHDIFYFIRSILKSEEKVKMGKPSTCFTLSGCSEGGDLVFGEHISPKYLKVVLNASRETVSYLNGSSTSSEMEESKIAIEDAKSNLDKDNA